MAKSLERLVSERSTFTIPSTFSISRVKILHVGLCSRICLHDQKGLEVAGIRQDCNLDGGLLHP
jgi:hypothetical protein